MKKQIIILIVITALGMAAQTTNEKDKQAYQHLLNGTYKEEVKNYTGAIEDYNKAIKVNTGYYMAYYNRANCYMALGKAEEAMLDFNKASLLEPEAPEPYYGMAIVYSSTFRNEQAIKCLDLVIRLNESYKDALLFRGAVKYVIDDISGCCEDIYRAIDLKLEGAQSYQEKFCKDVKRKTGKSEALGIPFPRDEKWHMVDQNTEKGFKQTILMSGSEDKNNWTHFFVIASMAGLMETPLTEIIQTIFKTYKTDNPLAQLTVIENSRNEQYEYMIAAAESSDFSKEERHASRYYFIVRAKETVYINYLALRKPFVPDAERATWNKIFKASEVIMR